MKKIVYILLLPLLVNCNPDGAGCFNSSGPTETIAVALPQYTQIEITGNIEVRLNPRLTNAVTVTAGSNLLPGIRTEVIDGTLYLENLNRCDFVRSFTSPIVEISNPDLNTVIQHGYGKVVSTDTLRYNGLKLIGEDGSGDFDVKINARNLTLGSNNIGIFNVSGKVEKLWISSSWNNAIFNCQELSVINCSLNQSGSNTMHLSVLNSISGSINSIGNVILYYQVPAEVKVEETNLGKLIFDVE